MKHHGETKENCFSIVELCTFCFSEHLNIVLFVLSKQYHQALSKTDTASLTFPGMILVNNQVGQVVLYLNVQYCQLFLFWNQYLFDSILVISCTRFSYRLEYRIHFLGLQLRTLRAVRVRTWGPLCLPVSVGPPQSWSRSERRAPTKGASSTPALNLPIRDVRYESHAQEC